MKPEFPKLTTKQAFDSDTMFFTSYRKCKDCGSYLKYYTSKSQAFVCCYDCVPYVEDYNKHMINKRVNLTKRTEWKQEGFGSASGGYNTVTR